MKLSIAAFVLLFSICFNAYTQPLTKNLQQVRGVVLDATSKLPVAFAGVSLKSRSNNKMKNAVSDSAGRFELKNIPRGIFLLSANAVGFQNYQTEIAIKEEDAKIQVLLIRSNNQLSNVTVVAKKPVIENKLDKMVYNVDRDITSQGGLASDVLKKVPGVTVDADGNVELLGNPSVTFLVDGKPSSIFGNSLADALQSIPASQIQSIEVMTSPPAKYDAAGTGGIINIILKKNKLEGFNTAVNLALGSRLENGSINSSYKQGRLSIDAYANGNFQLAAGTPNGLDRVTTSMTNRLLQSGTTEMSRNSNKAGVSLAWELSKNERISLSAGTDHFGYNNNGNIQQDNINYDNAGNVTASVNNNRNAINTLSVTDLENSLTYTRKLKKKGEELELSYMGSFGKNTTYYDQLQYYSGTNTMFAGSHSLNPGKENEAAFALDYTTPLPKNMVLETGAKVTLQSIVSNADVFTYDAGAGSFSKDALQSYNSTYRRTIYAGYASVNFSLFNYLTVKSGLRYEYTVSNANYSNVSTVAIPPYSNLAPSVIIGHNFPNRQTVKLAYSYRIERPDYRDLNPFMNLTDPHNITTGNPNLQPEIGHKIEMTYTKSFASGANINLVLYYQRNSPDIKPYINYYPSYKIGDSTYYDVTLTTRATISSEVRAGINISGSLPLINSKLTLRPNLQFFNRHLDNPNAIPAITDAFGYRVTLNTSYQFSKTLVAEVFGNYYLGMRWQGKQADVYAYTFAIKKELGAKTSIGFIAVNPFNKYIHQEILQLTQDFSANIYKDVPYRSFGLTFSYKFGKLSFSKTKEPDDFNYVPATEN